MPLFKLSAVVAVSAVTEVEADSLEAAVKVAKEREAALAGGSVSVKEFWVISEADGGPQDIRPE